jgi:DNA polymerase-3 subunit beta
MHFTIVREQLLQPLQAVIGVVEKRQTLPILSNVLLKLVGQELSVTGTDLEVELTSRAAINELMAEGEITVPAKKLLDITRSMAENSLLHIQLTDNRLQLRSGRSKFNLTVLAAADFPNSEEIVPIVSFALASNELKQLVEYTYFCVAQQDVRYYLNGILFEALEKKLNVVATDGHRLAMSFLVTDVTTEPKQIILPRKGVGELVRLLSDSDEKVHISFNSNQFQCVFGTTVFKSRLIDGRFPSYNKVIPRQGDKQIVLDKQNFKQVLLRVAVLANEKNRGVRLQLRSGVLQIITHNSEQEQAEEEMALDYAGADLDIGLNVNYLLDVVNAVKSDQLMLTLSDAYASVLLQGISEPNCLFVIMPMRL